MDNAETNTLPERITFSSSGFANKSNEGAQATLDVPISLVTMYNVITFSVSSSSSVSETPAISYLSLGGIGTNIKGSFSVHDDVNAVGAYIAAHPNGTLSYQAAIDAVTGINRVNVTITLSDPT